MRETQQNVLIAAVILSMMWAIFAWLIAPDYAQSLGTSAAVHEWGSAGALILSLGAFVYYTRLKDKLGDELAKVTAGHYFERDGLCFMPVVRVRPSKASMGLSRPDRAEISLYYQSRFAGPCEAVIHIRPKERAFWSHKGARDVHFAFRVPPGGFGVIHQPIAVDEQFEGEPVEIEIAAATNWPKTHRERLRSRQGTPVGTFEVDWALAYRQSKHELCGEIELHDPATMHLTMPEHVSHEVSKSEYTNETLKAVAT